MILALDVHYKASYAKCIGIIFNWKDEKPEKVITAKVTDVEAYEPGQFYKRELPCLLKIIEQVDMNTIEVIVVDGHVYTNPPSFGLGGHLYEVLDRQVPIIGVAKSGFKHNKNTVVELFRGDSQKPLHISAIGTDLDQAVEHIRYMHGPFRMPTLLTILDQHTKTD